MREFFVFLSEFFSAERLLGAMFLVLSLLATTIWITNDEILNAPGSTNIAVTILIMAGFSAWLLLGKKSND